MKIKTLHRFCEFLDKNLLTFGNDESIILSLTVEKEKNRCGAYK